MRNDTQAVFREQRCSFFSCGPLFWHDNVRTARACGFDRERARWGQRVKRHNAEFTAYGCEKFETKSEVVTNDYRYGVAFTNVAGG